jgi:uncharacterized protein YcaQ
MGRLHLLQLDSVPVVARTQYLPLFARLGPYDPGLLDDLAYTRDEWIEAWAHEASLVPVGLEPLLRWTKARAEAGETWGGLVRLAREEPEYVASVHAEVAERGPLAPSQLSDHRPRSGAWWDSRSVGSLALDWLFRTGRVGIRRTRGFEKRFDLTERIVRPDVLALPTPSEADAQRELVALAAQALGVATLADLADYFRMRSTDAKARVRELVEDGRLLPVRVEGWTRPALLDPGAALPRSIRACTLLSPFDPVVWHRERTERIFGFSYRLEIYTPAAKRRYGYYVLPFLLGDRLVARLDLKTDRAAGVLRVQGAFAEPDGPAADPVEPLRRALDELARQVGVDRWEVTPDARGDLVEVLGTGSAPRTSKDA